MNHPGRYRDRPGRPPEKHARPPDAERLAQRDEPTGSAVKTASNPVAKTETNLAGPALDTDAIALGRVLHPLILARSIRRHRRA